MQLDLNLAAAAPRREAPRVFGVGELTREIRSLLEGAIGEVWVQGEISNYRCQASGHRYFTLKDASAQLACVMFAGDARFLKDIRLEDGLEVRAFGGISVYEVRGQYQLIVRQVKPCGEGALQAKFEALKRKLHAEGLFDPARKRPLPRFPKRIGLVTSASGAALRDFLHVLRRRSPGIEVLLYSVRVQGAGAAQEIIRAITDFQRLDAMGLPEVDLLVLTRGGGSIEDLWEFNDEDLARAIADCRLPVVSAVGHEIDFTIADFAADVRAPTSSAAAELISADTADILKQLVVAGRRMNAACAGALRERTHRLDGMRRSAAMSEPSRRLLEARQELDRAFEGLTGMIGEAMESRQVRIQAAAALLAARHPRRLIENWRERAAERLRRGRLLLLGNVDSAHARLQRVKALLEAYNPERTLERGFSLTFDEEGRLLRSAETARAARELVTRFPDGSVKSKPAGQPGASES